MARVCILVIASRSKLYDTMIKNYWMPLCEQSKHYPGVTIYLLFGQTCLKGLELNQQNILQYKDIHESMIPGIYQKTLKAFEQLQGQFDYIFRTNLSSFVCLKQLVERVRHFPKRQFYAGFIYRYPQLKQASWGSRPKITYGGGSGFFVSSDVADLVVKRNRDPAVPKNLSWFDDVLIGHLLEGLVPLIEMPRLKLMGCRTLLRDDQLQAITAEFQAEKHFHARIKNVNRNVDLQLLKHLNDHLNQTQAKRPGSLRVSNTILTKKNHPLNVSLNRQDANFDRLRERIQSKPRQTISSLSNNGDRPAKQPVTVFLTYGDAKFARSRERIQQEAIRLQLFDQVVVKTESIRSHPDLAHHLRTNSNFRRVFDQSRGGGYWIWKPYIIHQTLSSLEDGDVLVYSDAGSTLATDPANKSRFQRYIKRVRQSPSGLLGFKNPFIERQWTKNDIFEHFQITDEGVKNSRQFTGNKLIIRKCPISLEVVTSWWQTALLYPELFDDSPSKTRNASDFRENRHDQSVLSVLLKKYHSEEELDWTTSPIQPTRRRC
jgi:hypothetical protein